MSDTASPAAQNGYVTKAGAWGPLVAIIVPALVFGYTTLDRISRLEIGQAASVARIDALEKAQTQIYDRFNTLAARESALESQVATVAGSTSEMRVQQERVADRVVSIRSDITGLNAALVEIETQFCAIDGRIALIHSYDLRFESMLFTKVFGQEIPTANATYPAIGRCSAPASSARSG